ncbi:MAG: hypothetical protein ACYC35_25380 [Pirellulales bacterium]
MSVTSRLARVTLLLIAGGPSRETLGRELLETGLEVAAAEPQTALIFSYRRQR